MIECYFINLYGNPKFLKEDIPQITRKPSFLKLNLVVKEFWARKVSKIALIIPLSRVTRIT